MTFNLDMHAGTEQESNLSRAVMPAVDVIQGPMFFLGARKYLQVTNDGEVKDILSERMPSRLHAQCLHITMHMQKTFPFSLG